MWKGVAYSDEPTENYPANLWHLSALWSFIVALAATLVFWYYLLSTKCQTVTVSD